MNLTANPTTITAVLKAAKDGDNLALEPGFYGDYKIINKHPVSGLAVSSVDSDNPAVFNTLYFYNGVGVHFTGVKISMTPTMATNSFSPALKSTGSVDCSFSDGVIVGGNSVNGVPEDALALDSTGNILGWPTAYGVQINNSTNIKIVGNQISHFAKGIVLSINAGVSLIDNTLVDFRSSGITGGSNHDLIISGNSISTFHPWRWGQTPVGDHGDFIHLWTNAGEVVPCQNIHITNNMLTQDQGIAILGLFLEDNSGKGFSDVTIANNAIINGNHQAMRLENLVESSIQQNVLLTTSDKDAGVLFESWIPSNDVRDNLVGSMVFNKVLNPTIQAMNKLVQSVNPQAPGYFQLSLLTPEELADPVKMRWAILRQVGA